jgi:hypothetical protein
MCDSRRPTEGADSEPLDRFDTSCSYCGRTVWQGSLRAVTLGGSTSWLCSVCHARQLEQYQEMTALDGIDIAAKEAARA